MFRPIAFLGSMGLARNVYTWGIWGEWTGYAPHQPWAERSPGKWDTRSSGWTLSVYGWQTPEGQLADYLERQRQKDREFDAPHARATYPHAYHEIWAYGDRDGQPGWFPVYRWESWRGEVETGCTDTGAPVAETNRGTFPFVVPWGLVLAVAVTAYLASRK